MSIFLIINPFSRSGKSLRLAEKAIELLRKKNFRFEYKFIKNFDDAYLFSRTANLEGYRTIVAIGGDGTINKVINGFFDKNGKRISRAKFGVIYTGTSPDFCKSYNIPVNIEEAVEVLSAERSISIPIGKIRYQKSLNTANAKTSYLACCANIGLGASLARKANGGIRKYLGDLLGTFTCLIQILLSYKPSNYHVKLDALERTYSETINLSFGLTPYIASGIKVPIDNEKKRNGFYVMKAGKLNFRNIIPFLRKIYSGRKFHNTEYLSINYASDVEIKRSKTNNEIEFDGDPVGYLPCRITIAEDRLDLIIGELR